MQAHPHDPFTHSQRSLITTGIDYENEGFQTGVLRVPYSHDRSAYGHIPVPVAVLKQGKGPTVLLTGGNHGDEYEGPVALMKLLQRMPSMRIRGRLIVIPALNFPAFLNGSRTSPIDRGNLNRMFPGDRNGSITAMVATTSIRSCSRAPTWCSTCTPAAPRSTTCPRCWPRCPAIRRAMPST